MKKFLSFLRNNELNGEVLAKIVGEASGILAQRTAKYFRYQTDKKGVPIFTRKFEIQPVIDSKINNDFFSEIIDTKVGYFAGKPASYAYDKEAVEFETASDYLSSFQVVNSLSDIDAETTKDAAITGVAYRVLYIDASGNERVGMLSPNETVAIYDREPNAVDFAFRIYNEPTLDGSNVKKVEFYNSMSVQVWQQAEDEFVLVEEVPHPFGMCPVIQYANNAEMMGDADKVLPLIDAYDRTLSDVNSEVESFRLAYIAFVGAAMDAEGVKALRETGALNLPAGADAKFLTKQIDDTFIENHLNRIEANIYRFSQTPNLNDKQFGGNQSGVALKYKLSGIDNKTSTFERKKLTSDLRMFQCIQNALAAKRVPFDAMRVIIEHTRNVPLDMNELADATLKFKGIVSDQTLLSLLPFVDDPQYEIDLIAQQNDPYLLGGEDGDGQATNRIREDDSFDGEEGAQGVI